MAFAATGFLEDLLTCPAEVSEVICEKDAGQKCRGAGTTAHSERNLVVKAKMNTWGKDLGVRQNVDIGRQDEVVFQLGAEIGVATGGIDMEAIGEGDVDGEIERHRETEGIEPRAKV